MSILSDKTIRRLAQEEGMIEPFVEGQRRDGCISYGLSSYGYDARVSDEFKIFTNVDSAIVDPKDFSANTFVDRQTDVCIIPPNSFALARTVEYFRIPRDVLTICLGKSTYARCFSGDTKVALANGTSVGFREMVERAAEGEEFYGYGIDAHGKVAVTKLLAPRLVGVNEKLTRVTLDNGESVDCTDDHRFVTRDGGRVEAAKMEPDQRLMPLYRYLCRDREVIYHPGDETLEATYRLSDAYNVRQGVYAAVDGTHRHHKDENKRNDYPTNIERMLTEEHIAHHNADFYGEGFDSEAHSMAIIAGLDLRREDPEWIKSFSQAQRERAERFWSAPEHQEAREALAQGKVEMWKDPGFRERMNASRKAFWSSPEGRRTLAGRKMPKRRNITPAQVTEALATVGNVKDAAKLLGTSKQYLYRQHRQALGLSNNDTSQNHRVTGIQRLEGLHDVYCLTSPETGNFALESGVFVDNCGIIVNVTPLEPEWEGHVTLEFSNTTPLPAKIYANEGACQFLFFRGDEPCEVSYADRAGKYMGQRGVTIPRL